MGSSFLPFSFHPAHERYSASPGSLKGLKLGGVGRSAGSTLLLCKERNRGPGTCQGHPVVGGKTHKARGSSRPPGWSFLSMLCVVLLCCEV